MGTSRVRTHDPASAAASIPALPQMRTHARTRVRASTWRRVLDLAPSVCRVPKGIDSLRAGPVRCSGCLESEPAEISDKGNGSARCRSGRTWDGWARAHDIWRYIGVHRPRQMAAHFEFCLRSAAVAAYGLREPDDVRRVEDDRRPASSIQIARRGQQHWQAVTMTMTLTGRPTGDQGRWQKMTRKQLPRRFAASSSRHHKGQHGHERVHCCADRRCAERARRLHPRPRIVGQGPPSCERGSARGVLTGISTGASAASLRSVCTRNLIQHAGRITASSCDSRR